LYTGSPVGITMSPAQTLPGSASSSFGAALAVAGDVNGDGYSDALVLATGTNAISVFLGGSGGLATSPATTLMGPGGAPFTAVAYAGDVNGDGFADVVATSTATTTAFLYLGSSGGLAANPVAMPTMIVGSVFGAAAAGGSDVNRDGFADVIIGASGNAQAFVYLGGPLSLWNGAPLMLSGPAGSGFGGSVQ
jgi:hypothetical protein